MKTHGSEHTAPQRMDENGESDEAKRALRENQALLTSLYDSSSFFMGVCELRGDDVFLVQYNAATARILGLERAALKARRVTEIGYDLEVERLWAQRCRESREQGAPVRFDFHI